jgi:hypothetical protein
MTKLYFGLGMMCVVGWGCSTATSIPPAEPLKIDSDVQADYKNYSGFDGTWEAATDEGTSRGVKMTLVLHEQRYSFHEVQKTKALKDISPVIGMVVMDALKKRTDKSCLLAEEFPHALTGHRLKDTVYLFNVEYQTDQHVQDNPGFAVPSEVNFVTFKWPSVNPNELVMRLETFYLWPGELMKSDEVTLHRVSTAVTRR